MPTRNLLIIRFALVTGVVLFTGVSFWIRRNGGGVAPDAEALALLRYALWGVSAMAIVVAFVVRNVVERKPEAQRAQLTLVGWAPGEGAALLGVVQHFNGGSVETMTVGLLAFVGALLILPIPGTRR